MRDGRLEQGMLVVFGVIASFAGEQAGMVVSFSTALLIGAIRAIIHD